MSIVVFLGPTLPVAEARQLLPDAVYLPPARQADVLSVLGTERPSVIALVDGEFGQSLSVWHKEILYALSRGVHVYGASSMGALRAAETAAFGAVGVGRIFEWYADGTLVDDDEVALAHGTAEDGYRPLSEPMVNVRATMDAAVAAGAVSRAEADALVAAAKARFFPERTLARAAAEARVSPAARARLAAAARAHRVDLKRADALALLERLRDLPRPIAPHVPTFAFEPTRNFAALYDHDRMVRRRGADVALSAIAARAALHEPGFNALNGHALDRALVDVLAEVLEVEASAADVAAERRRFRVERRLADEGALAAWADANDLAADELDALLAALARRRVLHRWLVQRRGQPRTASLVLDELRLEGRYPAVADRACEDEAALRHADVTRAGDAAAAEDERLDDAALAIAHMRRTPCRIPVAFGVWAEEAGFGTADQLRTQLLRERAARRNAEARLSHLVPRAGDAG